MRYMLLCYDDAEYWDRAGEAVHGAAIEEAVRLTHDKWEDGPCDWGGLRVAR